MLEHCQLGVVGVYQPRIPCVFSFCLPVLAAGNVGELYIEVVRGFGETLVGNHPGSALNCVVSKEQLPPNDGANAPDVSSVPDDVVRYVHLIRFHGQAVVKSERGYICKGHVTVIHCWFGHHSSRDRIRPHICPVIMHLNIIRSACLLIPWNLVAFT